MNLLNIAIWEGFKGGFMNPTLAGPQFSVRVKAITISCSSLHEILTSLIVQNFCM